MVERFYRCFRIEETLPLEIKIIRELKSNENLKKLPNAKDRTFRVLRSKV